MADEMQDPFQPETVKNPDVAGITQRIDRVIYELGTSESATTNMINQYDLQRLQEHVSGLDAYVDAVVTSNRMDLPHSFPAMYTIRYISKALDPDAVKNSMVQDFMRLLLNAMVQWSRSESADQSNTYQTADVGRWKLIVARINDFISKYIAEYTPQDLPENSNFELERRGLAPADPN